MMLTPEQLVFMRNAKPCIGQATMVGAKLLRTAAAHIDAQQARIAELEQDAAAERERIKKICGDVIDEWFNCAGGADEVLRRIEKMESDK